MRSSEDQNRAMCGSVNRTEEATYARAPRDDSRSSKKMARRPAAFYKWILIRRPWLLSMAESKSTVIFSRPFDTSPVIITPYSGSSSSPDSRACSTYELRSYLAAEIRRRKTSSIITIAPTSSTRSFSIRVWSIPPPIFARRTIRWKQRSARSSS